MLTHANHSEKRCWKRLDQGSVMLLVVDSQKARQTLDKYYKAINARRFQELRALLAEIADPDVVVEYPQSGERIKGRDNNLAILENYPGLPDTTIQSVRGADDKWVLTPVWTPLRIMGTGDHYSVEGRLVYPNGDTWNFVDLFDLRGDRVVKVTEYFAAPFPPPAWRARWVETREIPQQ